MRSFRERGGWWVVGQTVVFLVGVAGIVGVDDGMGVAGWLRASGWVVVGAGGIVAVAGFAALGDSLTPFPAPVKSGQLIVHGIYRFARHPIYGGVALGFVGLGLATDSLLALAGGGLLFPYFTAKSIYEEFHLAEQYPEYAEYRERVRKRLLPWLV